MNELRFFVDFRDSLSKYHYSDKKTFSSYLDICPVCESKMRQDYYEVESGMTSESREVCDVCGFAELFAYGNYETSFDGFAVPEDVRESQILLAILRKLLFFKLNLSAEEVFMVEILLEGKRIPEQEFEQLQKKITEDNYQVKGIKSTTYVKEKNLYEDEMFDGIDLDALFSELEPLDY